MRLGISLGAKVFFRLVAQSALSLGQDLFYEVSSQFCRVFVGLFIADWSVE
jgi:hypothetical protein